MSNNLYNMMSLDIYLSSLNDVKYEDIYSRVDNDSVKIPVMSWDIFSNASFSKMPNIEKRQDITTVRTLAEKFNWDNDIDSIFENQNFEAIIVTDINQNILWVNKGFSEMTGFTKKEALGNTPRFLQGPETSVKSKIRLRKKISTNYKPFKDVIINHKKNGETYKCEVKIFPLFSENNKSHYIALERRVV